MSNKTKEKVMSNQTNGYVEFLKGLVIGGAVGAVIGILYAPKSGKRTRRDIYNKSIEFKNDAESKLLAAQEKTSEILGDVSDKVDSVKRDTESVLSGMKEKTTEIIDKGKSKLKLD